MKEGMRENGNTKKRYKKIVMQAGFRALICNLVLGAILWIVVLSAVSAHHITAVLNYQLLLHLLILLLAALYWITFAVFAAGILTGLLTWKCTKEKEEEHESTI